jgi:HAMP domain-containing protein
MGLRLKFNLVLIGVFAVGLAACATISHRLLQDNARGEVERNAQLMMETALAIRSYTVNQVKPQLDSVLADRFLPQTVPAYAATETLNELRKNHPEYAYKEATLNPTNPRDRASDWETDLVSSFRASPSTTELKGVRDTPTGRHMYIARPIQISNAACLACHSSPANAPVTMVKLYGAANGFGWKHNEIVGAQVVSVPMAVPIENADRAFTTFMLSLLGVFLFVMLALNLMLEWLIIRPVAQMSQAADRVSTGDFTVPEFRDGGRDEVSILGASFNRMRRSLETAMRMIDG